MLPSYRLIGILWIVALVMGAFAYQTTVATDTAPGMTVMAVGNVRIRDAPSLDGDRLGLIGWGESATVQAVDGSGQWYQINYGEIIGWSYADWFRVTDVSSDPATSAATVDTPIESPTGVVVRSLGGVRLRAQPNVNAEQLSLIGWGEQVPVLAVSENGGWYQVQYRDFIGWTASAWYEVLAGDPNTLGRSTTSPTAPLPDTVIAYGNVRLRDAPSLNGQRLGLIPWGASVPLLAVSEDGAWYQVEYDGVTGWSARTWFRMQSGNLGALLDAAQTPDLSSPTGVAVRALGTMRIRAKPSLSAEKITVIGWGDVAPVLAVDASGKWYQIEHNGIIGWSSAEWFEVLAGDPASLVPGNAAPFAGLSMKALGNVRVRAAPSLDGERLTSIPWGTVVSVTAIDTSGAWIQVDYDGITGWSAREWFHVEQGNLGALLP